MLKPVRQGRTGNRARRVPSARESSDSGPRVVVIASEYNRRHVEGLLEGVREVLRKAGADFEIVRVPGAFEIPVAAEIVAAEAGVGAVVCLGVIIRGETAHADLVGESVTRALMEIAVRRRIPVVHEVLLVGNVAQADVRCLDPRHNRGVEAGRTALTMALWAKARTRQGGGGSRDSRE